MTTHYGDIAFTDSVSAVQERYGSRAFYARRALRRPGGGGPDPITRTSGSTSPPGTAATWPRSGRPAGRTSSSVAALRASSGCSTTTGGLGGVPRKPAVREHRQSRHRGRVALIAMDYPTRNRLKIFGTAQVVYPDQDADLVRSVTVAGYDAVVERAVVVTVEAFDWNCQQHIVERYSARELQPLLAGLRDRVAALEAENAELRAAATTVGGDR